MNLIAWGVHHKTAAVDFREKLAVASVDLPMIYERLQGEGFGESLVLSTCNRTEIYAVNEGEGGERIKALMAEMKDLPLADIEAASREFEQLDAVRHFYEVVASLDSMVIGEPEIVAQTKQAYASSKANGASGKVLNNLVQRAFQVAKRVRTETDLCSRPTSVGAVGATLALQIFGQQGAEEILMMGAGEMAEVSLRNLMGQVQGARLTVCNRSLDKAQDLAGRYGGSASGLDEMENLLGRADIVICSLATEKPLVTYETVGRVMKRRAGRPLFVIDLGVPRNVEPMSKTIDDIFLYDMDHLQGYANKNLEYRESLIESCEPIIEEGVRDFEVWMRSLGNQMVIGDVMKRNAELVDLELERSAKKLAGLNEEEMEEVRYLLQRTLKKALHHPIHSLRNSVHLPSSKLSWRHFFFGS